MRLVIDNRIPSFLLAPQSPSCYNQLMKRAFLSLKFHGGDEDKQKIDNITAALQKAGIETFVFARDIEKYGKVELPPDAKLMPDYAFPAMQNCDLLIVEFSEKGVGLGIGAGYAYAIGLPIYIIARTGSDISPTLRSLAKQVIFYNDPDELTTKFLDEVAS